jgi:hypothetical protein
MRRIQPVFLLCLCLQAAPIPCKPQQEQTKTFTRIRSLRIALASGDCELRKSTDPTVTVNLQFEESSGTKPAMLQEKDKLIISEEVKGPVGNGKSKWTITVPDDLPITFHSISGKLQISDLKLKFVGASDRGPLLFSRVTGDIDVSVVSGDLDIEDFLGMLNARIGSGHTHISRSVGEIKIDGDGGPIVVSESKAKFRISNNTGDVVARNVSLGGSSKFTSTGGNAEIRLSATPQHDLFVSSGSGEALVAFNGNNLQGKIIMRAGMKSGRINAPFGFEKEVETDYGRRPTIQKSTRMGTAKNYIQVNTVSGEAILKY